MESKISVIVCVYNIQEYLPKCLNSIISQSYSSLEIILVDDGSRDNSWEICKAYEYIDSRIILITGENGGLSEARNRGIRAASGDFILFIDGDDYLHKDMIKVLFQNIDDSNADISMCAYEKVNEGTSEVNETYENNPRLITGVDALRYLLKGPTYEKYVVTWNKLYKSEIFKSLRFPVNRVHEDNYVTPEAFLLAVNVVITDAVLYYYVQRENSITHYKKLQKRRDTDLLDAYYANILLVQKYNVIELEPQVIHRYLFQIILQYEKIKKENENDERKRLKKLFGEEYKCFSKQASFHLTKRINLMLFMYAESLFFGIRYLKRLLKQYEE